MHTLLCIVGVIFFFFFFHRIIVLEDGRVKEFDSPDTLLTLQPRTTFYEMAKEANLVL